MPCTDFHAASHAQEQVSVLKKERKRKERLCLWRRSSAAAMPAASLFFLKTTTKNAIPPFPVAVLCLRSFPLSNALAKDLLPALSLCETTPSRVYHAAFPLLLLSAAAMVTYSADGEGLFHAMTFCHRENRVVYSPLCRSLLDTHAVIVAKCVHVEPKSIGDRNLPFYYGHDVFGTGEPRIANVLLSSFIGIATRTQTHAREAN